CHSGSYLTSPLDVAPPKHIPVYRARMLPPIGAGPATAGRRYGMPGSDRRTRAICSPAGRRSTVSIDPEPALEFFWEVDARQCPMDEQVLVAIYRSRLLLTTASAPQLSTPV